MEKPPKQYNITVETTIKLGITLHEKTGRGSKPDSSVKPRITIWHTDENIVQNLFRRTDRPTAFYQAVVIPMVFEALKLAPETKIQWSQYAGCKCGCSPGFIMDNRTFENDIFVDLTFSNPTPDVVVETTTAHAVLPT